MSTFASNSLMVFGIISGYEFGMILLATAIVVCCLALWHEGYGAWALALPVWLLRWLRAEAN